MWYSEDINENDGIESILSLFRTETEFINHYFSKVLFFKIENVNEQATKFTQRIKDKERLPVRFSRKFKEHFYFYDKKDKRKTHSKAFKTREEAHKFSSNNDLYHKESGIKVITDKDGNYYVRKEIFNYTGYRVSQGEISDYKNYTISHIWANTSNPYFFSSLWNISLIPQTFSFILDKSKGSSNLVKRIKIITEILHIELYQINSLLNKKAISVENNFEKNYNVFSVEYKIAKSLISNKQINFLNQKNEITKDFDIYDFITELNKNVKNKDFIFTFLKKLKEIGFKDFNIFTDKEKTNDICKLSYPILIDITGASEKIINQKSRPVNSDVYYKKPFFEWNDKQFIICNDWKPWHREMLINWLNNKN